MNMVSSRWRSVMLFALMIFCALCNAGSPVWEVTKNNNKIYLGGTFHLLKSTDHPLPKAFEQAYSRSDVIALETDIAASKSPEFQRELMSKVLLPQGSSLKTLLNDKAYNALETHLNARNVPITNFMMFAPGMVAITLSVMEFQSMGYDPKLGVDMYFHSMATKDKKRFIYLESMGEQLDFIVNFGKGQENEMILYTLKDLKTFPTLLDPIKAAWRGGNTKKFYKLSGKPLRKEFPDVYEQLLVTRNKNWLPAIEAMFNTKDVEFVLVGALHLVGKGGLLEMLKKRGYKLKNLQ